MPAYLRAWRAAHPDYRERERIRCAERRRRRQLERDRQWVDELAARPEPRSAGKAGSRRAAGQA
jgi:hypothetical protein